MSRTYRVAEFAKLAGVTVRTLQYYDREGLLKPSELTPSKYRLYRTSDLLRLQQILTLKWMGFSLQEIKAVLQSPRYNLYASLLIQKEAVDAEIRRLQNTSEALTAAMNEVQAHGEQRELDAETIQTILRGVNDQRLGDNHFAARYYSEEAWLGIQTRGLTFTPTEIEQSIQAWQDLIAAFGQQKAQGAAPDDAAVQQLAAQMHSYIELFTGGDPETRVGLQRLVEDSANVPLPYRPHQDADLQTFMQEAYGSYIQHKEKRR